MKTNEQKVEPSSTLFCRFEQSYNYFFSLKGLILKLAILKTLQPSKQLHFMNT